MHVAREHCFACGVMWPVKGTLAAHCTDSCTEEASGTSNMKLLGVRLVVHLATTISHISWRKEAFASQDASQMFCKVCHERRFDCGNHGWGKH